MTRRVRYEVLPTSRAELEADPSLCRWSVTRRDAEGDTMRIATHGHKADAIKFAVCVAKAAWKTNGTPTQVIIKRLNGVIAASGERTYGKDPAKTPG